jgi:hypothetical protein
MRSSKQIFRLLCAAHTWIERVAQTVANKGERQHNQRHTNGGS